MSIQSFEDGVDFVHRLHNLFSGNVAGFTSGVLLFHPNPVCKTSMFSFENVANFLHIDAEGVGGYSSTESMNFLFVHLQLCCCLCWPGLGKGLLRDTSQPALLRGAMSAASCFRALCSCVGLWVNMDQPRVVRKTKLAALTFYFYFYSERHVAMQMPVDQPGYLSTAVQWLISAPLWSSSVLPVSSNVVASEAHMPGARPWNGTAWSPSDGQV